MPHTPPFVYSAIEVKVSKFYSHAANELKTPEKLELTAKLANLYSIHINALHCCFKTTKLYLSYSCVIF